MACHRWEATTDAAPAPAPAPPLPPPPPRCPRRIHSQDQEPQDATDRLVRGLEDLWSPWIGISNPYPCATALTLALALALRLALALALALPNPLQHRLLTTLRRLTWKKQKFVTVTLKKFPLCLVEAHEHRQDPGENGRRIENFIGENEHLSQIIGGRPVFCQNLINGGRRGKVTSRYYTPTLLAVSCSCLPRAT